MAAGVVEDSLQATIGLLEAIQPGEHGYLATAYPYPALRLTERRETRTFRTLCLENDRVSMVIAPDLGGRLVAFEDRNLRESVIEKPASFDPTAGGLRGAVLRSGITVALQDGDSLGALGTAWTLAEPEEAEGAALWTSQMAGSLSYNARWSIESISPELKLEVRAFNRSQTSAPYNGGLTFGGSWKAIEGPRSLLLWDSVRQIGLHILPSGVAPWCVTTASDHASLTRLPLGTRFALGPRQLDTWIFQVRPVTGFDKMPAVFEQGAMLVGIEGIRVAAASRLERCKLVVQTGSGTVESALDLGAGEAFEASASALGGIPIQAAILASDGRTLVTARTGARGTTPRIAPRIARLAERDTKTRETFEELPERGLGALLPGSRFTASLEMASESVRSFGPGSGADGCFEQALLYNAEDHLCWWLKGVNQRLTGSDGAESAELLNAHFLAPLEPALRAEGYLSQPQRRGNESSALVKPMLDAPESLVDTACHLVDAGFVAEAMRWLEEAIRHLDLPMLRYLLAACALEGGLETEAGTHIYAASKLTFGPPYPWRGPERTALASLRTKFREDLLLLRYAEIAATESDYLPRWIR